MAEIHMGEMMLVEQPVAEPPPQPRGDFELLPIPADRIAERRGIKPGHIVAGAVALGAIWLLTRKKTPANVSGRKRKRRLRRHK